LFNFEIQNRKKICINIDFLVKLETIFENIFEMSLFTSHTQKRFKTKTGKISYVPHASEGNEHYGRYLLVNKDSDFILYRFILLLPIVPEVGDACRV